MTPPIGSWARRVNGRLLAEPSDERELVEVLHVLADRNARFNRDLQLSRARLDDVGTVHERSMTVEAGAGVVLQTLDDHLKPHGLTLGPLSPAAMSLQLGDFLEGPYAGLRSIPGGRLEAVCTSLSALTSDGRRFETSRSPRSAAGPDLSALVLGGQGRVALVTRAVVRCVAYPERDVRMMFSFPSAAAFVSAMQRAVAEGLWPWRVHVEPRGQSLSVEVRWASSVGSVERDRALMQLCASDVSAGLSEPVEDGPRGKPLVDDSPAREHESTWDHVHHALDQGRALQLFRLTLTTVIARGDVEGLPLHESSAWSSTGNALTTLDARGLFGGAP
jgi:FAD/FMN-containing dehydrogenase